MRWNPYGTTCLPPYSEPSTSGGRQTCFLDANDTYTAWGNGNDIDTLFGKGSLALGGGHVLSLEYNMAKFLVLQRNAATIPVTVRLTNTHPYYPGNGIVPVVPGLTLAGRPIDALWSVADLGPRDRGDHHMNQRVVLNLEGTLAGWDYRLGLNKGWSERDTRAESGWARVSGLATVQGTATTLFLDPRLNPFGLQNAAGNGAAGQCAASTGSRCASTAARTSAWTSRSRVISSRCPRAWPRWLPAPKCARTAGRPSACPATTRRRR